MSHVSTEIPPSLYWGIVLACVTLPPLYIYVSKWRAANKLAKTGIGRGAPGFQTSVRQIAVTPEIAARLRRGEHVSPEEITAALNAAAASPSLTTEEEESGVDGEGKDKKKTDGDGVEDNEWLPDSIRKKGKNTKVRGKKR